MVDFWKVRNFNLGEFGYYQIFRIFDGDDDIKFFHVKYDSLLEYDDYMTVDHHNKIHHTSDLYRQVMNLKEDGTLLTFHSIDGCYEDIIKELYNEHKLNDNDISKLIHVLAHIICEK